MRHALALLCVLGIGCTMDTGQGLVEIPVSVRGTDAAEFAGEDGWTITLDRADVAFGPLTLCASINPGDACESARAEMLETVVIDAVDPLTHEVGALRGSEGTVRSLMHDYGVSWLLTQTAPAPIDGASLVASGHASRGTDVVLFDARITIAPSRAGLVVVRRSLADGEEQTLTADSRLTVVVDPRPWFAQIDWDEFDPAERVAIAPDTQAHRALVQGMTSCCDRPTLEWD